MSSFPQDKGGDQALNSPRDVGQVFQTSQPVKGDQDGDSMFINVTESPSLDKASRTKVRVQVMRDFHQRRIQKTTGKTKSQNDGHDPTKVDMKGQTQKFRLGKGVLKRWVPVKSKAGRQKRAPEAQKDKPEREFEPSVETSYANAEFNENMLEDEDLLHPSSIWETARLYQAPSNGMLDPFSAMAVLITPRTQLLLHHYFSDSLLSSWLMMPMRRTLLSLAVHDTAMFHSFLCHYATKFNVQFRTNNSTESMYHATTTASLINEKLSDSSQALTDETIGTVANMAAYESSNGSMSSMVIHMDGLEKMVNLRGGLHEGGFSMIIQRIIGWADYHVATAILQKPRFPPLLLPETAGPQDDHSLRTGLPQCCPFKGSGAPNFEQLSYGIRDLAEKLRIIRQASKIPSEDIWYSDKIYFLQRNLFDLAQSGSDATPLDRVCALAALIYCGHCLRDIPLSYAVTANAVTRLKNSLELLELTSLHEQHLTDKCFWILGFGGVAAEGKPEQEWFAVKFRAMSDYMGLPDWTVARSCLDRILWQVELDAAGERLWEASP
ncbi:uncharacterized protein LY89DRAFT_729003 [Mollisia scopiformis]|uniref:Uncharacterized protein n=1 Tax=Mollisia scopiformis TaxID=149040 RepID=A0A194XRW8_MOLSC|nr:uncharacterized protein LY89DRAFT_729003 [Mollisia scopiformis]KUJ22896.1 hypothetical protein LY89DRAFT_729003 [Mollisia scopiformis]